MGLLQLVKVCYNQPTSIIAYNQPAKMMNEKPKGTETRQERREKKLQKKRERIPKHGKNLAKIYVDAILKRLKRR